MEEEKMICKNCGKKIGLCGNCYNAFNEGDKIICDAKNNWHFLSMRCAILGAQKSLNVYLYPEEKKTQKMKVRA